MHIAQAVGATAGELAAVGIDGQLAVQGDTLTAFDESAAFAGRTKSQRLQPDHGEDGKPVV